MAISILITNKKIGKSILYSEADKKGKKKVVPLYRMIVANESGSQEEFGVTRDTIVSAFGQTKRKKIWHERRVPAE